MPRSSTTHPGVALLQKVLGRTYTLKWRDPRIPTRPQRFNSAETNEHGTATRIAEELSELIRTPELWQNLHDHHHPRTRAIWGAETLASQVEAIEADERDEKARLLARIKAGKLVGLREQERLRNLITDKETAKDKGVRSADALAQELAVARTRIARLEGMLRKMGARVEADQRPVALETAIQQFMAGGTGTQSKYRGSIQSWLNRFARELGPERNVWDVQYREVTDHLARFKGKGNLRQVANVICQFLQHATSRAFDREPVIKWTKDAMRGGSNGNGHPFWPDLGVVEAAIAAMRTTHGDYWADVMTIQWGCGFRPEELGILRTGRVETKSGRSRIRVERIFDGKDLVRGLKTARSEDWVVVPDFAAAALNRRLAAGGFLLFPRSDEAGEPARWHHYSEFEKANRLWPDPDKSLGAVGFSKAYLARLREAVRLAAQKERQRRKRPLPEGYNPAEWDSRTLRRTCGRDLLLAGRNITEVSAVLRDSEETVRRHYARLLSGDVDTNR